MHASALWCVCTCALQIPAITPLSLQESQSCYISTTRHNIEQFISFPAYKSFHFSLLIPQSHKPLCPCPRQQPPGSHSSPHTFLPCLPRGGYWWPQKRHLAGIFLNHLLWLNSCSLLYYRGLQQDREAQTHTNRHKNGHMHRQAASHAYTPVHKGACMHMCTTLTLISRR